MARKSKTAALQGSSDGLEGDRSGGLITSEHIQVSSDFQAARFVALRFRLSISMARAICELAAIRGQA